LNKLFKIKCDLIFLFIRVILYLENSESSKSYFTKYLIFIILCYFLCRLLYLATHISIYIPPDEITHFGISKIFSKTFFLPKDSIESYELGLITHVPYLYYYIMGRWVNLNFFGISDLIFLRMGNVIIIFITALYGLRWIKLVTSNRISILLFIVLLTNTPMLSFLGASVNYDNLINLFAIITLFYLHSYLINYKTEDLLFCCISLLGGTLTKGSFLPLVFIYFVVFLFHERKRIQNLLNPFKELLARNHIKEKFLFFILMSLLVCNLTLYVGNLIKFKTITPYITQVLTEEQAMQNRIYARDRILGLYKDNKITRSKAIQMTDKIKNNTDRLSTLTLIAIEGTNKIKKGKILNRFQYAWAWMRITLKEIVGITGHVSMLKDDLFFHIYSIIVIAGIISSIIFFKTNNNLYLKDSVIICSFYCIILMQFYNYPRYEYFSSILYALQGRYFFPVIIPFYALISYYLTANFKNKLSIPILICISLIFIYGDFPYLIKHISIFDSIPSG
jgi:hypothetical protein